MFEARLFLSSSVSRRSSSESAASLEVNAPLSASSDAFVSESSAFSSASVDVLISSSSSRSFWIVALRAETCRSRKHAQT